MKKYFNEYTFRLFSYARDVLFGDDHALSTLCGESYDKCTKEDFLDYLGLKNPNLPFPIYFTLTNDTSKNNYYNQTTFQCNQPVITPYKNESICSQIVNSFNLKKLIIFIFKRIAQVHLRQVHRLMNLVDIPSKFSQKNN